MSLRIKSSLQNQLPTKDELSNLDFEQLYSIAKESNDFRQFIIDFILENGYVNDERENKNLYLNDLEMSVSLRNSLRKGNFNTLNELTNVSKKDLKKINFFGQVRIEELVIIMEKYNLKLADINKI